MTWNKGRGQKEFLSPRVGLKNVGAGNTAPDQSLKPGQPGCLRHQLARSFGRQPTPRPRYAQRLSLVVVTVMDIGEVLVLVGQFEVAMLQL